MKRLAIIGGGAWGTALGIVARRAGLDPGAVGARPRGRRSDQRAARKPVLPARHRARPGDRRDDRYRCGDGRRRSGAARRPGAIPARRARHASRRGLPAGLPVLHCAKGIETGSLKTMSEIGAEILPEFAFRGAVGAELRRRGRARPADRGYDRQPRRGARPRLCGGARQQPVPALSVGRSDRRRNRRRGQERAGDRLRDRRRPRFGRQCPRRADHPRARRDGPAGAAPRAAAPRPSAGSPGSAIWC